MSKDCATIIGIILQLLGAIYLVIQSYRTTKKLQKFKGPVTYGSLSPSIEAMANELSGQFSQQLIGFFFVFLGSAFQLYAAVA
jgi:uncharacterized membrane protein